MNDDVAQIHQYPFASLFAFRTVDVTACLLDLVVKIFGERTGLPVGRTAHDDHAVKHTGHGLGVKDLDILAFDIF